MDFKNIFKEKKEETQEKKKDTGKKVAVGVTLGTVVGSVVGILLAPKSGKETRQKIVDKAKDTVGSIKNNTDNVKYTVIDSVEDIREEKENGDIDITKTMDSMKNKIKDKVKNTEEENNE